MDVWIRGYLAKLLENKSVGRYLQQREPEVLAEFEAIVKSGALDK